MNMRFLLDLVEAALLEGRDAPLYHGTSAFKATKILQADRMEANTQHFENSHNDFLRLQPDPDGREQKTIRGVSMTRSLAVALDFYGEVVFEIDQTTLRHRHRIEPMDYWGHSAETKLLGTRRIGRHAEAEEFVVGAIDNFSTYLRAIYISARAYQRYTVMRKGSDSNSPIDLLLNHPLLVVHKT
jgi:hypothetical protein